MASLIEMNGGQPQKQPKYVPIFSDRCSMGSFYQRPALHDPSDLYTSKFYGGRPDAIWSGSNVELTNRLTLQRRPGLTALSTFTYPTPPDYAYSFQLSDGTIRLMIDTAATDPSMQLTLTAVATSSGGVAVYTGTITGGANNAFRGLAFTVTGFATGANNGYFVCSRSSATTLTLVNASAVAETHAGLASTIYLTSVANASGGNTVYTGIISGGGGNAYAGYLFYVSGFPTSINNTNGTPFLCTASSATTLTLANAYGTAESGPALSGSAGAVYYDHQNNTSDLLFAKGIGAGQTHFQAVGGVLYMGDGVDTRKYTPLNPNNNPNPVLGQTAGLSLWNWGAPGPVAPPGVTVVPTGSSTQTWVGDTFWSTFGLVYDTTTQSAQQVFSVNATGTNTTSFGTTGPGQPAWAGIGSPTTDGTVTWTNRGPIKLWQASTLYQRGNVGGFESSPCIIFDPGTKTCWYNGNASNAGTSGTTNPASKFASHNYAGAQVQDGGVLWNRLGNTGLPSTWQASHAYALEGASTASESSVVEPADFTNGFPTTEVYWQVVTTAGTSGTGTTPPFSATIGTITSPDGDIQWLSMGSYVYPSAGTASYAFLNSGIACSVIKDSNGNFQVCTKAGVAGSAAPTWQTAYGAITDETLSGHGGTSQWTCVGQAGPWTASIKWYFPGGWTPAFGGASIVDSNSNVEFCINSGLGYSTGHGHPTWNTTVGTSGTTVDGTGSPLAAATWQNAGPHSTESTSWANGYSWGYSYKSLAYDDFYASAPTGGGFIPPGITKQTSGNLNSFLWTGVPTGSATNLITNSSPAQTITGPSPNGGAVVTLTGVYSTDPQIDTIVLWRSTDGGGPAQMYELTEIPNNPNGGTWTFKDFLPDLPTANYPGLNTLLPAPIDLVNSPPLSGFLPMTYNFERIWGADGEFVPFSGGRDTKVGNPNEAFPPSNEFPFLAPVTRLIKISQGTLVFLTNSIQVIGGGPATASFFAVEWAAGIGLVSFNALDQLAGETYFFSADNQFRVMTPALSIVNAGFAIGDQLANLPSSGVSDTLWDAKQVYVASHQNGIDNCIIVSDGNTGWYRLNPRQVPGTTQGPEPIWSPYANITNGCQMVQSIETTPGIKKLLVGGNLPGKKILYRDLTVYTDDGTQYGANFVMGSIVLAHPGQLALLKFLEFDFSGAPSGLTGFRPTISYLLNEISGSFTAFTNGANGVPQFDPPSLYGVSLAPTSYSPNRYYFAANGSLARCRHMQIKVDYGTTAIGDEMYNFTIFGRVMVET